MAAAAIVMGVAVEQLFPHAASRYADAVVHAQHRREVAHHDDLFAVGAPAHETEHIVFEIVRVQPRKSGIGEILLVQRGLLAIGAVQIAHPIAHALMRPIVQQRPVERLVMVPFAPLRKLAAHEQKLLARMCPHVSVKRSQAGELLPLVAGHLVQQ